MTELGGRVVLCRNLTRFYHQNVAMARRPVEWAAWRDVLDRFRGDTKSVYVAQSGCVRSSLLSGGSEVAGLVENSVIYPGVSIAPGARVQDSVVMSHNHVGRGATLQKALVLPGRDRIRSHPTVEEKVTIGGGTSNVSNSRFPEQIHDGITVLGPGVELPRGITVDQGCYLSASYPAASLRKLRKLARGSSYLSEKVADGV
jgi:ADP-glucose pyrophosphorylase